MNAYRVTFKYSDFVYCTNIAKADNPERVYIRGEYDRTEKRYEVTKFNDFCDWRMMKGDRLVYTGFTF